MRKDLLKGLTEEQIAKVKACKNHEELLALAKSEGIELTDEQLAAISGGGACSVVSDIGDKINPYRLSRRQFGLVSATRGNMRCMVDKKTNVISLEFKAQDPLIAATMVDSVKNKLQLFITRYRTNKARNDLEYMERLFTESKQDYDLARQQYARFSDANTDVILQSVNSKREDLENDMQLKYNIYTQVTQQLQLAKAKLQESTPAFTVIQGASVPVKSCNIKKIYILALFIIMGFIVKMIVLTIQHRKELFKYNN